MELITTAARIFPRERWITEEDTDSRYRFIPHSEGNGRLLEAAELTLDSGASRLFRIREQELFFLLPVVGRHAVFCGGTFMGGFEPGQLLCLPVGEGDTLRMGNLSGTDLSLAYCFRFAISETGPVFPATAVFEPQLPLNRLNPLRFVPGSATPIPAFAIGRYAGRAEDKMENETYGAQFFLVLQGAAEVEGRLLHAGEALLLQDYPSAEWEALTNDTILVTIRF